MTDEAVEIVMESLSVRRAWIEICQILFAYAHITVALREESVD